jgi:hypothetical protein
MIQFRRKPTSEKQLLNRSIRTSRALQHARVSACAAGAGNQGQFVSCVNDFANEANHE